MLWVLAEEVDFPRPSQGLWSRKLSTISLDIRARHGRSRVAEGFSQDFKKLLEFHHQSPVTFLKVVSEPILASIYGLSRNLEGRYMILKKQEFAPHLADHHVLFVKMSTKHFGSVASRTFNFYAHLKAILMLVPILSEKISTSSPFLAEGTSCSFFCNKAH